MVDRFDERAAMRAANGGKTPQHLAQRIPAGLVLAGGVNSDDHEETFTKLTRHLRSKGCHAAVLRSRDLKARGAGANSAFDADGVLAPVGARCRSPRTEARMEAGAGSGRGRARGGGAGIFNQLRANTRGVGDSARDRFDLRAERPAPAPVVQAVTVEEDRGGGAVRDEEAGDRRDGDSGKEIGDSGKRSGTRAKSGDSGKGIGDSGKENDKRGAAAAARGSRGSQGAPRAERRRDRCRRDAGFVAIAGAAAAPAPAETAVGPLLPPRPVVVIVEDTESFDNRVLSDLLLALSDAGDALPVCVLLGVATSASMMHGIIPAAVAARLRVESFRLWSPRAIMTAVQGGFSSTQGSSPRRATRRWRRWSRGSPSTTSA